MIRTSNDISTDINKNPMYMCEKKKHNTPSHLAQLLHTYSIHGASQRHKDKSDIDVALREFADHC